MSAEADALYTQLENEGVMIFAAAGNQGLQEYAYPASHPSVVSVAAVYEMGTYWQGSNLNDDQVELAAPGYRVLSTSVITSSVRAASHSYPAYKVTGAPPNAVEVELVYCGPGNYPCTAVAGVICLMVRDETPLSEMLENCKKGGGHMSCCI
jgi:subtilisin family serine protease